MEIRAGTGGNEAALFAADFIGCTVRYAEPHGFKIEELESSARNWVASRKSSSRLAGRPSFEYCDTRAVFIVCSGFR